MNIGEKLTNVEVARSSFVSVVVDGQFAHTWAGEAGSRVIHPHIDPNVLGGELDTTHLPRCDETQYVTVRLEAVYGSYHASGRLTYIGSSAQNPDAPIVHCPTEHQVLTATRSPGASPDTA